MLLIRAFCGFPPLFVSNSCTDLQGQQKQQLLVCEAWRLQCLEEGFACSSVAPSGTPSRQAACVRHATLVPASARQRQPHARSRCSCAASTCDKSSNCKVVTVSLHHIRPAQVTGSHATGRKCSGRCAAASYASSIQPLADTLRCMVVQKHGVHGCWEVCTFLWFVLGSSVTGLSCAHARRTAKSRGPRSRRCERARRSLEGCTGRLSALSACAHTKVESPTQALKLLLDGRETACCTVLWDASNAIAANQQNTTASSTGYIRLLLAVSRPYNQRASH